MRAHNSAPRSDRCPQSPDPPHNGTSRPYAPSGQAPPFQTSASSARCPLPNRPCCKYNNTPWKNPPGRSGKCLSPHNPLRLQKTPCSYLSDNGSVSIPSQCATAIPQRFPLLVLCPFNLSSLYAFRHSLIA